MTTSIPTTSLVEFTVSNYRSIKEPVTFSMIAGKARKNTFYCEAIDTHLLRSAVIFGANASGKSNLLRYLFYIRQCVAGTRKLFDESRAEVEPQPFLLDKTSRDTPTTIELHIVHGSTLFVYNVELLSSKRQVILERLKVKTLDNSRAITIFERKGDTVRLNSNVPVRTHGISKNHISSLEPEMLFVATLSRIAQKTVAHAFKDAMYQLEVENSLNDDHDNIDQLVPALHAEQSATDAEGFPIKEVVLDYLAQADMSISDLRVKKAGDEYELFVTHTFNKSDGTLSLQELPFYEESGGTKKFLGILLPIMDSVINGSPLVVDELGANLHPTLLRHIISIFNKAPSNPQLILTSHEATLMDDREALTRDQIYFMEKQADQTSDVYSLADFPDIRNSTPNLSKKYLAGEFGANPKVSMG